MYISFGANNSSDWVGKVNAIFVKHHQLARPNTIFILTTNDCPLCAKPDNDLGKFNPSPTDANTGSS
jgi:hypothetical protein